jgi:hypothetical protein
MRGGERQRSCTAGRPVGHFRVGAMLGAGEEITVAFCSAKDAAFAERKATMRQLLISRSLVDGQTR